MLFHKSFYLLIWICYANAVPPIEQVMEKLIKLISEDQVKMIFRFIK
jgi:F0F1-type ATP synthase membrane subunit b/b'